MKKELNEVILLDSINNTNDTMNLLIDKKMYTKDELKHLWVEDGFLFDDRVYDDNFNQYQAVTGWGLTCSIKIPKKRI